MTTWDAAKGTWATGSFSFSKLDTSTSSLSPSSSTTRNPFAPRTKPPAIKLLSPDAVQSQGYFAFSTSSAPPISEPVSTKPVSMNLPLPPPPDAEAERRARETKEREAREALSGEIDWVRSGGILRDPVTGKRDHERTKAIRAELKLKAEEEALTERWEAYEKAWKSLPRLINSRELTFHDIPWPIAIPEQDGTKKNSQKRKIGVRDLTPVAIEEFLTDVLRVRGTKISKKERIRASLLRWHPDKMTSIVSRVAEDDIEEVKKGVAAVAAALSTRL